MRISRRLIIGGLTGLALALSGCDRMKPGRAAPELSLTDLRGQPLSLSSLRGRVVLVGFFATWAPPCRLAMLTWARHLRNHGKQGFTVVGVAVHEEQAVLERTIKQTPPGFPVYVVSDPDLLVWLGKADVILPQAYLIDGFGRIHARYQGVYPGDAMTADIESAVASLPAIKSTEGK
jgi:peroxiredoxin